jgi:2'-5' RNA ligase
MDKLARLRDNIEKNTEPLGFKREARAFSPHLTLGRVREGARPDEIQRIGKLLGQTFFASLHKINVNQINLMKSVLTETGAFHTCIGSTKLK